MLIERVIELSGKSEQELAAAAFDEFKRVSIQDGHHSVEHCMTLLAVALRWVDKPKVHTRVMDDGVRISDRIG